jgi:hypothetical protein
VLLHIAKHGQQELSKPRSEFTRADQTALFAQAVARTDFLINDAKRRAARLRQQFSISYSPAIRELGTLTQGQYFYGPDVCKVFESYKEPRTRLHTLQAKVQMLMTGVIKTDAELDLYCECVLAIDEESREILAKSAFSATHHPVGQSTQSSQKGPPVPAASHTTASRGGPVAPIVGQTCPPRGPRVRGGRFRRGGSLVRQTPVGPSRDSSSGTGGTQDARTTSSSVAPPVQGGGRQASVRGDDASQPGSPRVRIDSSVEAGTQHAPSEVNKLFQAASAMVALRSSIETSERNLATLSAAAPGGPSGTSGPTPAPSSTIAQGSSSRPSGRNPAASSSTVQGGPSRTSGSNPAASSTTAQGSSSRPSGRNPAASSSTAQGGQSGGMREPIPAASSAASDDMTAWTNAAIRALNRDPNQRP